MLIRTRAFEKQCMEHFKELAFKDIYEPVNQSNKSTHIYVRSQEIDNLGKK